MLLASWTSGTAALLAGASIPAPLVLSDKASSGAMSMCVTLSAAGLFNVWSVPATASRHEASHMRGNVCAPLAAAAEPLACRVADVNATELLPSAE
eukprot:1410969-Pyramimonas_sp.AAC.1